MFVKEKTSKLVINTDKEGFEQFKLQRQRSKETKSLQEQINQLKKEIISIKEVLNAN